jgi:hypothetical protein
MTSANKKSQLSFENTTYKQILISEFSIEIILEEKCHPDYRVMVCIGY